MLSIEVAELVGDAAIHLELSVVSGEKGLKRRINIPRIQKPGLALIGDTSKMHPGRVQVLGKSEVTYLKSLNEDKSQEIIHKMCEVEVACFVVTRDNEPPKSLITEASARNIPVLKTPLVTSTFINRLTRFLENYLTASTTVHGVLVDVFGVGMLIIGKSGIGKSECALDLVLRGHRLVADDVVEVRKRPPATLRGSCSELIKHHMEIRGLGILNIKELYGVASIRDHKLIEIVVELVEWGEDFEYDRLGIDEHKHMILDVPVPYVRIPVSPGRNVAAIIEVAARNNLLKAQGYNASREFDKKLQKQLISHDEEEEDVTE